jgi:hypothetical protein
MRYKGRIVDGVVVLEGGAKLQEGTEVVVEPLVEPAKVERQPRTLAERYANFTGKAVGLPEDLAENHDHYLHGLPKKRKET